MIAARPALPAVLRSLVNIAKTEPSPTTHPRRQAPLARRPTPSHRPLPHLHHLPNLWIAAKNTTSLPRRILIMLPPPPCFRSPLATRAAASRTLAMSMLLVLSLSWSRTSPRTSRTRPSFPSPTRWLSLTT
uniref:(northern house mosquito) hypothetical protein n=1 Tax=Culex pipiens TaxID=7175 RepID=A0A8D8KER2_CULPI